MENFLWPYVERTPHTATTAAPCRICRQQCHISQHCFSFPFYLNAGIDPTLSASLMADRFAQTINKVVQVTLEWINIALAAAQTNLVPCIICISFLYNMVSVQHSGAIALLWGGVTIRGPLLLLVDYVWESLGLIFVSRCEPSLYNWDSFTRCTLVARVPSVGGWVHNFACTLFHCNFILFNSFRPTAQEPMGLPLVPGIRHCPIHGGASI